MTPKDFPESTKVLLANPKQPEIAGFDVGRLPVWSDGNQTISCWQLTFLKRLKALIFGHVWLGVHSGPTQVPAWLSVDRSVFHDAPQNSEQSPKEFDPNGHYPLP